MEHALQSFTGWGHGGNLTFRCSWHGVAREQGFSGLECVWRGDRGLATLERIFVLYDRLFMAAFVPRTSEERQIFCVADVSIPLVAYAA